MIQGDTMIALTVIFLFFNGLFLYFKSKVLVYNTSSDKGFKPTYLTWLLVNLVLALSMFNELIKYFSGDIPTFEGLEALIFVFLLFTGVVLAIRYFYHKFYQKKETFRQEVLHFIELLVYFSLTMFAYSTMLLSFTIYIIFLIG